MSTLTRGPAPQDVTYTERRRVRGLAWLMVRQHRAVLIACATATLIGALWMVHERSVALDALHAAGWPAKPRDDMGGAPHRIGTSFARVAAYLAYLPFLFGVFVGAPLIASDHEHGTARLVSTQSVPRMRWVLWKLGFALTLAVVTTGILGGVFGWWWRSVRSVIGTSWLDATVFDNTFPMLIALTVFTTSLGILIGVLIRRAVAAMVVTFFTSAAALLVADHLRTRLATPRRTAGPLGGEHPAVLSHGVEIDQWVGTASGKVYGWGTCVDDAAPDACRARLGIVHSVWDYFGDDQMATIQWTASGLLLGAAALMVVLAVWRARRQAL
ncbi:ABC transporter permease [Streptomyces sp. NPDC006632]|uniref:ABC transporter permease n=1 Tax=Streptomyces sp. NPDC006632 TaxID=3157182 RepID=UPI0033A54147